MKTPIFFNVVLLIIGGLIGYSIPKSGFQASFPTVTGSQSEWFWAMIQLGVEAILGNREYHKTCDNLPAPIKANLI